ncbi:MAG: hypothetical protein JSR82_00130 [Verrucomicrobia bacterium]|nr:hypothetical protein [Verrucomicrobiota bacterium]
MFRVTLDQLIFLYLFACVALVGLIWWLQERRRLRQTRHALQDRVHCSVCAYDFEDASSDPLPICPRCGTRNERPRSRPL